MCFRNMYILIPVRIFVCIKVTYTYMYLFVCGRCVGVCLRVCESSCVLVNNVDWYIGTIKYSLDCVMHGLMTVMHGLMTVLHRLMTVLHG